MASSAHARSIDWMRKEKGWQLASAEQTVRYQDKESGQWKMFKRDLFGIADYIAVDPSGSVQGTIYVQITTGMNNKGERTTKIENSDYTRGILKSGNTIELHIWRKMGPRGKRKFWKLARFHAKLTRNNAIEWFDVESEGDDFEPVQTGLTFGDDPRGSSVQSVRK